MATGKLQIQVTSQLRAAPVEDAVIDISSTGEPDQILEEVRTDSVGQTDTLELEAPPEEYSLSPGEMQPYSEYNFRITAPGYKPLTISGAEILANQLALQDIRLKPLAGPEAYDNVVIPAHTLYGDYPPKIAEAEIKPLSQSGEIVLSRVVIPEFIVCTTVPRRTALRAIIMCVTAITSKMWLPAKSMPPGRRPPSVPMCWRSCRLP